jgi:uncharacterized repeat protein (TIGR01451 family)
MKENAMRIVNLLLTTALFALLGNFCQSALAAEGALKVTGIAQTEVVVTGKDGKKTLKRTPVTKAIPGTEVIYTTTFENTIKKAAGNISIDNPIPNDSEYVGGSAFGKDCEILFSVDGGKTFGHAEELRITDADGKERAALPREYTHIRWKYKAQLAPGKSGEVGFRAVIK